MSTWARSTPPCIAQERAQSNQQDLIDQMQANRLQNADRTKILLKTAAHQSLIHLKHRQGHEREESGIRFGHLLICKTTEIALTALAVIPPLVRVTRPLRLVSRVLVSRIRTAAPARPRDLIMRLPTGMHVVRTAPQHRVGDQHDSGQVGQEIAQDRVSRQ